MEGLEKHPKEGKLWIHLANVEASLNPANVKAVYEKALKACPHHGAVWIEAALFEERQNSLIKARILLEQARRLHPQNDAIWLVAIQLELRHQQMAMAKNLLAKALQQ